MGVTRRLNKEETVQWSSGVRALAWRKVFPHLAGKRTVKSSQSFPVRSVLLQFQSLSVLVRHMVRLRSKYTVHLVDQRSAFVSTLLFIVPSLPSGGGLTFAPGMAPRENAVGTYLLIFTSTNKTSLYAVGRS
jgi:hypothetical protein